MEPELCENDLLYCHENDSDECEIEIVVRIRKPYTIRDSSVGARAERTCLR